MSATLPTRDRHAQLDVVLEVVQHAWTGTILSVLHGLWVWRTGILFEPLITTQQQWVKLVTRTQSRIRALSYSLRIDEDPQQARAARAVLDHLTGMYQSTQLTRMVPVQGQATQYICFFDGGSRGNPGQVVRVASSSKSTDPLERRTSSSAPACLTEPGPQQTTSRNTGVSFTGSGTRSTTSFGPYT